VVILGILAMHVVNPITGCTSQSPVGMAQAHTAPAAADRVVVADHSRDPHSDGATHGPNQCTATLVRKALFHATGTAPAFAVTAVAVASFSLLGRRRDLPLVPDPLSVAGGLRR
jgi:hypothetical protein